MLESGFPATFWGLAVGTAEFLYNRKPHSSIQMLKPYQKWTGLVPNLKYISVFGVAAYCLNENRTAGKKFQEVSDLHFLLRYMTTSYMLFDPRTKRTIQFSTVKIDESRRYRDIFPSDDTIPQWSSTADKLECPQDTSELETEEEPEEIKTTVQVHTLPQRTRLQSINHQLQDEVQATDLPVSQDPVLRVTQPRGIMRYEFYILFHLRS